jgi:hypothetical protein
MAGFAAYYVICIQLIFKIKIELIPSRNTADVTSVTREYHNRDLKVSDDGASNCVKMFFRTLSIILTHIIKLA